MWQFSSLTSSFTMGVLTSLAIYQTNEKNSATRYVCVSMIFLMYFITDNHNSPLTKGIWCPSGPNWCWTQDYKCISSPDEWGNRALQPDTERCPNSGGKWTTEWLGLASGKDFVQLQVAMYQSSGRWQHFIYALGFFIQDLSSEFN